MEPSNVSMVSARENQYEPFSERPLTIREHLKKCILHITRPIENLPVIHTPELASLGRCVILSAETMIDNRTEQYVYQGLIFMVTADCLSLLHCTRFTEDEFKAQHFEEMVAAQHVRNDENAFRHMTSDGNGGASLERTANCPDFNRIHPLDGDALPISERSRLNMVGSIGPLPCVTFSRKKIRSVRFAINPSSSFYSLFFNPDKKFFDMQCLRMFVRRYLVHTSQGNNPDGIPLRAFIVCRCNCPQIENALLEKVAQEELKCLLKEDKKIKSRRAHLNQDPEESAGISHAPLPIRIEGIRYASLLLGIAEISLAMFIAMFGVFSFFFALKDETFSLIKSYWYCFFIFSFLCLIAGGFTIYHVVATPPPLQQRRIPAVVRASLGTLALGGSVGGGVVLLMAWSRYTDSKWAVQIRRIFIPSSIIFFLLVSCCVVDLIFLILSIFFFQERVTA